MGQIIVRNLDDAVIERLKARAAAGQRSLEQTVRDILTEAAGPSREEVWQAIDAVRRAIGPVAGDSTQSVREARDAR